MWKHQFITLLPLSLHPLICSSISSSPLCLLSSFLSLHRSVLQLSLLTSVFNSVPPPSHLGAVLTCHQQDGVFIWMQLHLPGDPGPVEVSVPPALLLVLGVFVLVARPDERDAEVSLLPVHGHLVLPGRDGRGWILLGCLIG